MAICVLLRTIPLNNIFFETKGSVFFNCIKYSRNLNYFSKEYNSNPDPAPVFIKEEVQTLLKCLTRIDMARVYRKRKSGEKHLKQPTYKFLTDAQLQTTIKEIQRKSDILLQFPPVVAVRKPIENVLSNDSSLKGLDTSKYIFTDISFGVRKCERLIVIRNIDGTLKDVDFETRDRMNQTYFPRTHCTVKIPKMFEDEHLEPILNRQDYLFILDRACLQFEPNNPIFQKVTSIVYQHVNDNNAFNILRSTRHFGGLAFFLAWNKVIDNMLLELIETAYINEVNDLIKLYGYCHGIQFQTDGYLKSVQEYIEKYSNKKAALQLAIQAYGDLQKQREDLEKDIKFAHGLS